MSKVDIAKTFAASFKQAAGDTAASSYSGCIRFVAIMLVIIAVMWCINHFMGHTEKEQEGFLILLGSRLIRIVLGFCLFILILIVKGS
ncbi:TPA: hypothetical protein JA976_06715 [Legionella pneumophila]|nr:hypothetical protein [Legionella pneumophila]HCC3243947.1 hypothetical protein [Legionella pneumophila subsp. pneumophila]HAT7972129.1 hypothetical protein [Legionella pneumophila]HAT8576084.1 hypothetical protein [Legionella pneumophila]HAU2216442.1 hypothetical protein [Legionella pneumophila]